MHGKKDFLRPNGRLLSFYFLLVAQSDKATNAHTLIYVYIRWDET